MATIRLPAPLSELAGSSRVPVEAATVGEALDALERALPALAGWILDEQGGLRRHVNVFVDGEPGDLSTVIQGDAHVHVLPAITGGCR